MEGPAPSTPTFTGGFLRRLYSAQTKVSQGGKAGPTPRRRHGNARTLPAPDCNSRRPPRLPVGKMAARRRKRGARDSEPEIPSPPGYSGKGPRVGAAAQGPPHRERPRSGVRGPQHGRGGRPSRVGPVLATASLGGKPVSGHTLFPRPARAAFTPRPRPQVGPPADSGPSQPPAVRILLTCACPSLGSPGCLNVLSKGGFQSDFASRVPTCPHTP